MLCVVVLDWAETPEGWHRSYSWSLVRRAPDAWFGSSTVIGGALCSVG